MDPGDPRVTDAVVEHEPWIAVWGDAEQWPGQAEIQGELTGRIGAEFGARAYVAPGAAVVCESLHLGDRSFVAAGCVLRDRLWIGDDCSLNPGVVMAGRVAVGNGVRIASHSALFGFNHVFDRLDVPIWMQGLTEDGIVVEDDVWIGTHVVICDGVTVGAHSVIAAGAVVTRDVPPFSVVGGVPARMLRDRRDRKPTTSTASGAVRRAPLERFSDRVREQWPAAVQRCRRRDTPDPAGGADTGSATCTSFLDRPGASPTLRADCDAIEIAAAFGDFDPVGDPQELAARLAGWQDEATGLFPDPAEGMSTDPLELRFDREYQQYGVLSVGYALEVLGAGPLHPVRVVEDLGAAELLERLDALPWAVLAWPAGAWIDFYGTAAYLNRRHHGSQLGLEALFGWLQTRRDPRTGMWGQPHDEWGLLMPVNGFYRLTRGTYAQFGELLGAPESVVDTVVAHCRDYGWFETRERNACNVLDVVHPLWLCARQTGYRVPELRDSVAAMLETTIDRWVDGEGFGFAAADDRGLQGTEMWLSIVFLMADYLGESDGLSWRPRGVHRLEPADSLRPTHGGPEERPWTR
jgi:acetyltransferase-like isoleucine patch superfamily enzyme